MSTVQIAERRGIPEKYLVHILLQLKRAGIVKSVRGSQGGYLLAQQPEDITMAGIVTAIDGPILDPLPVDDAGGQDLKPAWLEIAKGIHSTLDEVSVRDILDRAEHAHMYYI
jgi:Rrf2 family protein